MNLKDMTKKNFLKFRELIIQAIPQPFKKPLIILYRYSQLVIRNPIKSHKLVRLQVNLLREHYNPTNKKLVIFLTPGYDIVNGGILSINSIFMESAKLLSSNGICVIMCIMPGEPNILHYTKFYNNNYIYKLSQVLSYFNNLDSLIIHIPEYGIYQFLKMTSSHEKGELRKINNLHFNILLQNIDMINNKYIIKLKKLGKVTCTTAHEQYSNHKIRKQLGIPIHKLSTFVDPNQYNRENYSNKENLLIVSPDSNQLKNKILKLIYTQLPQIEIKIIRNLNYEAYKSLISKAKWALTFGEGLDGYFIETIFSGGISFAVYNSRFFTKDFKSLKTVYSSYDELIKNICSDITRLDNPDAYINYQNEQYKICAKYYNYNQYLKNLELFYKGCYTYE